MNTVVEKVKDRINKVAKSSAFSGNGALTFSVPICMDNKDKLLSLPGKHCPEKYLDSLGITDYKGRAAVVSAGNGGLASELLRRGVDSVDCFEPHWLSEDGLKAATKVMQEFSSHVSEDNLSLSFDWPTLEDGKYDIIVFPHGLDSSRTPMDHIEIMLELLNVSGILLIEFSKGQHGIVSGSINSWKPSKKAFETTVDSLGSFSINHLVSGRLDNTIIYKISHELLVIEDINDSIEESFPVTLLQGDSTNELELPTVKEVISDKVEAKSSKDKADTLTQDQKRALLINKGLFTDETINDAIAAFGDGFLDDALKESDTKKVEPKKRPVKRPTKTKKTTRKKRVVSKKKSK